MSVSFVSCVLFVEIFISFYRLYKMCVFFSSSFLQEQQQQQHATAAARPYQHFG